MLITILFFFSIFMIYWPNIGYPIFMLIIGKILKRENVKNYNLEPNVTLMIVAHNEEKVIKDKMQNAITIDYPREKLEILVTSDNSTDLTNSIVKEFIAGHNEYNIKLYEVKERKGKTNAQNEATKLAKGEIIVMTDANSILCKNSIKELVASFSEPNIVYVSGQLIYVNKDVSETSMAESSYWDFDTKIRDIESRLQTITAGNGALYACRANDYYDFDPIRCHDSAMPLYYSLHCKRAISNNKAVAYEKAGETNSDELKRKIRMNRGIIKYIFPSVKLLNIFKYKWFSFFYFGHRTSRYLLWFNHLLLFITNLLIIDKGLFYMLVLFFQIIVYFLAFVKKLIKIDNKLLNFINYYCMTIVAQFFGVWNTLTGRNKPFWEKAESTR